MGWSSKQLTTLKPLLSEIEYLQDQHLLLTVKSLDGYESYGKMKVFIFVMAVRFFNKRILTNHLVCFYSVQESVC